MSKKIKVLIIMPWKSSFIESDMQMLERHFEVKSLLDRRGLKSKLIFALGILWADVSLSWFAGAHSSRAIKLSKLARTKTILIVGGYEVARVPELGYGAILNPKMARIIRYSLENADKVLAVSEFSKKEIQNFSRTRNLELLYNGIDCSKFEAGGDKEDLVITVGSSKVKGIDTFAKVASALPEIRFAIIGNYEKKIRDNLEKISRNIIFTGHLNQEELVPWMKRAKVYCQLSYRESFGMALAEAMCCECVPVVTRNGALPEVVGDVGLYVPYGDSAAAIEAVNEALKSDKGKAARYRIKNSFSLEMREKRLTRIIENLVKKGTYGDEV